MHQASPQRRLAAIDIGSSAARIAVAEPASGGFQIIWQHRYATRVGRSVFGGAARDISPAGEAELIAALHAMQDKMQQLGVGACRAVATSALREAHNGQAVARRLAVALGLPVEVIDGAEEAALIRRALLLALARYGEPASPSTVAIDLGGGSTELGRLCGDGVQSLPIGSVRLLQRQPHLAEPLCAEQVHEEAAKAEALVTRALEQAGQEAAGLPEGVTLVGSGGALQLAARLAPDPAVSATAVPRVALPELTTILITMAARPLHERAQAYRLPLDRAELSVPALLLLRALCVVLRAERLLVPGAGLRDALLADLMAGIDKES